MGKLFFGLVLLVSSLTANAQTKNVRLEMTEVPATPTLSQVTVLVLADGTVERTSFSSASRVAPVVTVVDYLSANQVEHINDLVEAARSGKVVKLPTHAMCFRQPDFSPELTADNESVFLRSGTICEQQYENTAPEAVELSQIIENLYTQYGRLN